MNRILTLLLFDLRESFNSIIYVGYSWFYFALQFFVYAALLSRLVVSVQNFYIFYGAGLIILSSFNIASWAGRRFVEFAHEGRMKYLLSLPIKRSEFFIEQIIHGVTVNVVRMLPPLFILLWTYGSASLSYLVGSAVLLSLSTIGIMGLMLSLSVVAFKSFDIYSAIVAALSAILVRFSTINYPITAMKGLIRDVSLTNPLTYIADVLRFFLGIDTSILVNPYYSASAILALAVGTIFFGISVMAKHVEGVKSS